MDEYLILLSKRGRAVVIIVVTLVDKAMGHNGNEGKSWRRRWISA